MARDRIVNVLEKMHSESIPRRGPKLSIYYSIFCLPANHAVQFLLPKLSQLHLYRVEDMSLALDIFMQSKTKAAANS